MQDLRQKILASAGWTSLLRYLSLIINVIGGIYLARMIDPEIFGRIGFMTALISLITMASMWGFLAAFMRKLGSVKENMEYLNTLFTIDCLISGLTVVILIGLALVFKSTLGFFLILLTLSKVPMFFTEMYRGTLVKEMKFEKLFVIHFTSLFLAMGFACILAFKGLGLWALAAKYALENISIGILSYFFVPYRLKFALNKEMARDFFDFGKYAFASASLEGGYTNIDRISLGTFLGTLALGFYERAHSIASYLHTIFWDAVSPVFVSLFGNLKEDRVRLSKVYNLGSSFFFRLYLIFFIWLGLLVPELIKIVYGEKWLPTVSIVRWLIPFFILTCLRELNRTLQLYIGNSKTVARIQTIELVSFLVCLFPFMYYLKATGVALALDISIALGLFFFLTGARHTVDIQYRQIFVVPLIGGLLTVLTFSLFKGVFYPPHNVFAYLGVTSLIIFSVYILCSFVLEYKFIFGMVKFLKG